MTASDTLPLLPRHVEMLRGRVLPDDLDRLRGHLAYLRQVDLWGAGVPAAEARFYMVCQPHSYGLFDWERLVWLVDPDDDKVARVRRGSTTPPESPFVHVCSTHGPQVLRPVDDYVAPWEDSTSSDGAVTGSEACGTVTWNKFVDQSGAPKSEVHAEFIAREERLARWSALVQDIPEALAAYEAFCRFDYTHRPAAAS